MEVVIRKHLLLGLGREVLVALPLLPFPFLLYLFLVAA
jgi:hypothetical protein